MVSLSCHTLGSGVIGLRCDLRGYGEGIFCDTIGNSYKIWSVLSHYDTLFDWSWTWQ